MALLGFPPAWQPPGGLQLTFSTALFLWHLVTRLSARWLFPAKWLEMSSCWEPECCSPRENKSFILERTNKSFVPLICLTAVEHCASFKTRRSDFRCDFIQRDLLQSRSYREVSVVLHQVHESPGVFEVRPLRLNIRMRYHNDSNKMKDTQLLSLFLKYYFMFPLTTRHNRILLSKYTERVHIQKYRTGIFTKALHICRTGINSLT